MQQIASVHGKRSEPVAFGAFVELRDFGAFARRGVADDDDDERALRNSREVDAFVEVSGRDRLFGHERERDALLVLHAVGEGHTRHDTHVRRRVAGGRHETAGQIAKVAKPFATPARSCLLAEKLQHDLFRLDASEQQRPDGRKRRCERVFGSRHERCAHTDRLEPGAKPERRRKLVLAMKPNESFFEPPGEHHVVQELLKLAFTQTH